MRDIEVVGDEQDISGENWNCVHNETTFACQGHKLIYWDPLKPLENLLMQSPMAGWAYAASNINHNGCWLNTIGKGRVRKALRTEWGRLWAGQSHSHLEATTSV